MKIINTNVNDYNKENFKEWLVLPLCDRCLSIGMRDATDAASWSMSRITPVLSGIMFLVKFTMFSAISRESLFKIYESFKCISSCQRKRSNK